MNLIGISDATKANAGEQEQTGLQNKQTGLQNLIVLRQLGTCGNAKELFNILAMWSLLLKSQFYTNLVRLFSAFSFKAAS